MLISGVSHPVPTTYAERIYDNQKTVFVCKAFLSKVVPGNKFIIYESKGARAYTGWADIKFIGQMKPNEILKKYNDKLMVTEEEFNEYSKGRPLMTVIEFENFEKFNNPVVPNRYVGLFGKYIHKNEFDAIKAKKDLW